MHALLLLLVAGCSVATRPQDGAPDLLAGDLRDVPDPALAIPPRCIPGSNCLLIDVPATPWLLAPDAEGGAWLTFPVGQGNDADGIFQIGDLSAPFGDNGLYGDTFLAHVDGAGTWDALTPLGDANVTAMEVAADGSVALIGTFYPQATLDGVVYTCGTFDSDFWVGIVESGGGWRWVEVLPRTDFGFLAPSALARNEAGDAFVGVLGAGGIGGMSVGEESMLSVVQLDGGSGDALWSRALGVGIPTQIFVDPKGAVYVAGGGSSQYGGVVLGVEAPFPNLFLARVDGGEDWVATVDTFNGVLLSGVWALPQDGDFTLGVAWATAEVPVTDGTLTFGALPTLPMAPWQDGAIAGLASSGQWRWARPADAITRVATMGRRTWTTSQAIAYDATGLISGFPEFYCERLPDGPSVGCRSADDVVNLAAGGGALWQAVDAAAPLRRITP